MSQKGDLKKNSIKISIWTSNQNTTRKNSTLNQNYYTPFLSQIKHHMKAISIWFFLFLNKNGVTKSNIFDLYFTDKLERTSRHSYICGRSRPISPFPLIDYTDHKK